MKRRSLVKKITIFIVVTTVMYVNIYCGGENSCILRLKGFLMEVLNIVFSSTFLAFDDIYTS